MASSGARTNPSTCAEEPDSDRAVRRFWVPYRRLRGAWKAVLARLERMMQR
jgi:hypothetical protein